MGLFRGLNTKNGRTGHLWQGRYRSWYVTSEAYLYTLIRYIEYNPLKAKIVKHLKEYSHSAYRSFIEEEKRISCLKNSLIFEQFTRDERIDFFQSGIDEGVLDEMKKASNLVVTSKSEVTNRERTLKKIFDNIQNLQERNDTIYDCYKKGYSQYQIAKCLNVSQPTINKIVKRLRG